MSDNNDSHLSHDAPLVELVRRLGGGRTLRERVIALRWKRRRKAVQGAEPVTAEVEDHSDSIGRTAGANPATAANLVDGAANMNQQTESEESSDAATTINAD